MVYNISIAFGKTADHTVHVCISAYYITPLLLPNLGIYIPTFVLV